MAKLLFLGIFLLAVGIGFFFYYRRVGRDTTGQIAAARSWQEATAVVDMAEATNRLQGSLAGDLLLGPSFSNYPRLYIRYRFQVGGRTYQGTRFSFGPTDTSWGQAKRFRAAYTPGKWIKIRYNPANPSDCVVEPRLLSSVTPALIITPIVALMGVGIIVAALAGLK
jgi:hypothetical protein